MTTGVWCDILSAYPGWRLLSRVRFWKESILKKIIMKCILYEDKNVYL
jgi:hypothetical protein